MGVHGYPLQIKNIDDGVDDGDGQLLLNLLATVFQKQEREPLIGGVVHPLRVSFCFVYLIFMTLFCPMGSCLTLAISLALKEPGDNEDSSWQY